MSLAVGSRLGPYEIIGVLGAGGMGEVFRARDTRLGRDVALKVLPAAFEEDPERLARFRREAQLLAALNDPHIAAIHGIEEADGVIALALELVEGEDLAERLKRGAIPIDEALALGRQIAEGLEAAHEKGIVHRDLKPANVKLAPDGKVKILDFGLAKAWEGGGATGSSPDASHSPTMTRGTEAGIILGTAAYMSPEQARGKPLDKRADIWAFGVVVYEMLTGQRLFAGETVSDVLAAVLRQEVDWTGLPGGTPREVRLLLRRCLERAPKDRLHDIGDARLVLDDLLAGRGVESPATPAATTTRRGGKVAAIASVAALAVGLAAGYFAAIRGGAGVAESRISFERLTFRPGHFVNARFAPDGQTVFLSADWDRHDREIFQVRPKAGELSVGLAGTELLSVSRTGELAVLLPRAETGNPYRMSGTLAVVSASGGTPRKLADDVFAADWAPDGKSLAALRIADSKYRVEYPLGTLLYESPHRISWIRVSPKDDAVAFFEPDAEGHWSVVVVRRSGAREVWSAGWADWWNLAWSPDGEEIWFGAAHAGAAASLYATGRGATLRTLLSAPGTLEVHDVAPDRSVLVAQVDARARAFGGRTGEPLPRDLSWLEDSSVADLSADGSQALLGVTSEREPDGEAVYLRSMDGAPPVRLGSGSPQELSRDGKWALAIRGGSIVALPTAAGEERGLETKLTSLEEAHWMPDGTHVLVVGREPGGQRVASVFDFEGGQARVVAARLDLRVRGSAQDGLLSPVSPDGRVVAAAMASGQIVVLPLAGGEARPLAESGPNDIPIQWTPDGRHLFLFDPSELPAKVYRVEVASGRREVWREIQPLDREGVTGIASVLVTPDATAYAYSYRQFRSNLYLVKGLR